MKIPGQIINNILQIVNNYEACQEYNWSEDSEGNRYSGEPDWDLMKEDIEKELKAWKYTELPGNSRGWVRAEPPV